MRIENESSLKIEKNYWEIESLKAQLQRHELYERLKDKEALKKFMEWHIFAVWDFMSLLKSLQVKLTSVSIPWNPAPYPSEVVRLVNEIVLGEESDFNYTGEPLSHFEMYLSAMKEVGANTEMIEKFLKTSDFSLLPESLRNFVSFNLDIAMNAEPHIVAGVFFYGREKLIPEMFEGILLGLGEGKKLYPQTTYYFERHIEVDSEDHGPMAEKCMNLILKNEQEKAELLECSSSALLLRRKLWDACLGYIDS